MRSSTPPCPGSSAPLSLSPAERLNMLSVRSPTTEKMPTTQPKATHGRTASRKCAAPPQATRATASSPPAAPSHVLPGLTRGASLCRPKLRPAKYAPMSAAITTSSSHSTSCGPVTRPWPEICSRASETNAGTSTGTPHSRVSCAGCRCGARASQNRAMAHQTQAMIRRISRCAGSLVHCQLNTNSSAIPQAYARRAGARARAPKRAHSQAPMVPITPNASTVPRGGSKNRPAASRQLITIPVAMRSLSIGFGRELCGGLAEAPFTLGEELERRIEMHRCEFGPQHLGEVHFGVREIPQQEVADALFTAGADQKVRIGNVGEREPRADLRLIDIGCQQLAGGHLARERAARLSDVPAAAVGHRDAQTEPGVRLGQRRRIRHALRQLAAQQVPVADE